MTELMLKLAAFLAMVIDHAAACRLDRVFFPGFSKVYVISRAIGRMAFPIYAFCLVEGFRHSHDLRRYGGRLLLLGVISQLPYAFTLNRWYLEPAFGEVFPADPSRAFRNLNILFTLFIGLVLLVFFHKKPLARVIQSKGFAVFLLACGGFAVCTAEPEFDSRFRRLCTVLLLASAIAVALLHVWRKHLALRDWLARFAVLVFAVLLFERYPLAHLRCNIDYGVWGILLILCLSYAESRWSRALVVLLWGALFYSSLGMPDWGSIRGTAAASAARAASTATQPRRCDGALGPRHGLPDRDHVGQNGNDPVRADFRGGRARAFRPDRVELHRPHVRRRLRLDRGLRLLLHRVLEQDAERMALGLVQRAHRHCRRFRDHLDVDLCDRIGNRGIDLAHLTRISHLLLLGSRS